MSEEIEPEWLVRWKRLLLSDPAEAMRQLAESYGTTEEDLMSRFCVEIIPPKKDLH